MEQASFLYLLRPRISTFKDNRPLGFELILRDSTAVRVVFSRIQSERPMKVGTNLEEVYVEAAKTYGY